tara:strand:+ start:380 stop:511 length:132 start_codon:yes stop_codon:yes gene_type:complete
MSKKQSSSEPVKKALSETTRAISKKMTYQLILKMRQPMTIKIS